MDGVGPLDKVVFTGKEGGSGAVTRKVVPKTIWDIEKENQAASEVDRKNFAKEDGLPEDATWDQITQFDSEVSRKKYAKEEGLPEDATWSQITDAQAKKSQ